MQVEAHVEVGVLFVMHVCQQPSIAPSHTGSMVWVQSGSQLQLASQLDEVLHVQLLPQSGSHVQAAWQLDEVSHAHPPICSQRSSTVSHCKPVSQPPPLVHAHPNAPIGHELLSPPQAASSTTNARTKTGRMWRQYITHSRRCNCFLVVSSSATAGAYRQARELRHPVPARVLTEHRAPTRSALR